MPETNDEEELFIQFVSPKIIAFDDYRFFLLKNSVKTEISPTRYYRPDYVSFDEYGTTNLWALLLHINDIGTLEDFDKPEIFIPSKFSIFQIGLDIVKRDLLRQVIPLHDQPPPSTPPLFLQAKGIPEFVDQSPATSVFVPSDLFFERESFSIDIVTARQRYIDLQFDTVPESVTMNVSDQPNFILNKHYAIIRGERGLNNRLTWDSRYIPGGGIGLVGTLVEGVEFEITYARKV